jgi:hypothetical protein
MHAPAAGHGQRRLQGGSGQCDGQRAAEAHQGSGNGFHGVILARLTMASMLRFARNAQVRVA